jgi:hypothetical protein
MNPTTLAVLAVLIVIAFVAVLPMVQPRRKVAASRESALEDATQTLGLAHKMGRYNGVYRGESLTVMTDALGNGYTVIVQCAPKLPGKLHFSGPSLNAGASQPELKIRTGLRDFDRHFWVARQQPDDYAPALLGTLDGTREQMTNVPFGRWMFDSVTLSYSTKITANEENVRRVADILVDVVQAVREDACA